MVVAVSVGRPGINALLVASQVVLSIVLPFVTLPLIYLTSSKRIMSVRKPTRSMELQSRNADTQQATTSDGSPVTDEMVNLSNGKIVICVATVVWLVVLAANMYVIIMLGLGSG
jgi:metal iron transporter